MSGLIAFLCEHGLMLLGGSTALLAVGSLAATIIRSPAHRQRVAECSVAAAIVWAVLACVPMRRLHVLAVREPTAMMSPAPMAIPQERPAIDDTIVFDGEIPPEVIVGAMVEREPLPAMSLPIAAKVTSPVTPTPLQPGRAIHWDRVGSWGFVAGAGAMAAWLLAGRLILQRMIQRSEAPAAWLEQLLASLPETQRMRPRLLVSPELSRPVSFGLWRPCIVLPAALAAPAKRQCVRQVLLHELAHLCRGDAWGNLVLNVGMIGLYFHPLYWWLRAQAGLSRELVADDWAAQKSDRQTYAEELIALARMDGGGGLQAAATIGILGSTSQFYRRIHMLLDRHTMLATRCSRAWRIAMAAAWSIAVIGAAAMMGVGPVRAQNAPAGGQAAARMMPGMGAVPAAMGANSEAREAVAGPSGLATSDAVQNYVKARELDRLTEAEFKLSGEAREAQSKYQRVNDLVEKGKLIPEVEQDIEKDTATAGLLRDMSSLKLNYAAARNENGKDHASVKKLERMIELTQEQLDARRRELRDTCTKQLIENLKDQIARTQSSLEAVQKRLDVLRRELEIKAAEERDQARKVLGRAGSGAPGPVNALEPGAAPPGAGRGGLIEPAPPAAGAMGMAGVAARPAAVGGVQLDLVNLANSAVNAVGTLRLAEVDLARIKQMANTHTVSEQDVSHAESNCQTARRRVDLFRGLVKVSLAAAERELKTVRAEAAAGRTPQSREDEATTKIEMLKLILGSMD